MGRRLVIALLLGLPLVLATVHESALQSENEWLRSRIADLEREVAATQLSGLDALWPVPNRRALAGQGDGIHEHDAAHATVFTMGTHVWVFFVCGLTLILIVFTVILERLISLLHDIPDSYQPVVHKVQEEFMLMGAVSFIVVLVEGITPISHDLFLNFEFAHLLLFFAAVLLALFGLNNLLSMRRCKKIWTRLEREKDITGLIARFETQQSSTWYKLTWSARHLFSIWLPDARNDAEHLVMRHTFFKNYGLRDTVNGDHEAFDFSMFLRKSLKEHVENMLEMSYVAWSIVGAVCVALMLATLDDASYLTSSNNLQDLDEARRLSSLSSPSSPSPSPLRRLAESSSSSSGASSSSGSSSGSYAWNNTDCGAQHCGVGQYSGYHRWDCAHCYAEQSYVEGGQYALSVMLGLGWSLLASRLMMVAWIQYTKRKFLREHAGGSSSEHLLEKIKELHETAMAAASGDRSKRTTTKTLKASKSVLSDDVVETSMKELGRDSKFVAPGPVPDDEEIEAGELSQIKKPVEERKPVEEKEKEKEPGTLSTPQHAAPRHRDSGMFEEMHQRYVRDSQKNRLATAQLKLSKGVFVCGSAAGFAMVIRAVRLLEAFNLALVLMSSNQLAVMIFGPGPAGAWWMIVLLMGPGLLSASLSTLTLKEFSFLYAICHPELNVLVHVEHDSRALSHDYEALREHFWRIFVLTNTSSEPMEAICEREFKAADADSNGLLSHKEFTTLCRKLLGDTAPKHTLKRILRVIDNDQSGGITLEEFVEFARPASEHARDAEHANAPGAAASKPDTNGAGDSRQKDNPEALSC